MTVLLQLLSQVRGARSHRFRGHHLEVDSYDFVPVILRHVKQKLVPGNARTGHNYRWWSRKAGLWKREVTHQKAMKRARGGEGSVTLSRGKRSFAFTCTCSSRSLAAPALDTSAWKAAWASRGTPSTLPGSPSSPIVSRAAALSRSQAATAAPSRAKRTQTARPMPLPAPAMGENTSGWVGGKWTEVRGKQGVKLVKFGPGARSHSGCKVRGRPPDIIPRP